MQAIELRGISKRYGRKTVLQDLNLVVESGTFTVILGSPASGKSVLVRLITGLEKATSGTILLRDQEAAKVSPGERNIGYVPQSFALYPHYRVYNNISYPLDLAGFPKGRIDPIVRRIAEQLKIDQLLSKHPDQLSGGEKQRVALARGVVKHTDLYILDDPLVGLDFKLREQMFDDLKQMQKSLSATFVFTTSDPLEALALADKVAILQNGRIVEDGDVEQMYRTPQHLSTMSTLGFPQSNRLAGQVFDRSGRPWCQTDLFGFPVIIQRDTSLDGAKQPVSVVIRPEDIVLDSDPDVFVTCDAQIVLCDDLGAEMIVYLEAQSVPLVTVIGHDQDHLVGNDRLTFGVRPSSAVLFQPETGRRIGQGVDLDA